MSCGMGEEKKQKLEKEDNDVKVRELRSNDQANKNLIGQMFAQTETSGWLFKMSCCPA